MRRFKPSGESVNPYQRRPDARLLIAHGVADGGLGARDRGQLAQRAPGDGAEIDMTVQGIGITCAAASARGRRPDTNRPRIIRVSSASNRNPESNLACLWSSVSGSAGCGAGGAVPGWRARREGRIGGRPRLVLDRDRVLRLDEDGCPQAEIAETLGCSQVSISRILRAGVRRAVHKYLIHNTLRSPPAIEMVVHFGALQSYLGPSG
jgi:hypothetical protein